MDISTWNARRTLNIEQIIAENERRKAELHAPYNPLLGLGGPLERRELVIDPEAGLSLWLPLAMFDHEEVAKVAEAGSLRAYHQGAKDQRIRSMSFEQLGEELMRLRCKYDFEFWAATCAQIKDKEGRIIPFWLNKPQRKYVGVLERQRQAGKPVRAVVLKHRQWGCTTLSYTYIAWHQIELYKNRDAWFIGHNKDGANDVVKRYDVINENYPYGQLTLKPYGRSLNTYLIMERSATLSVGSVERPNAPSGRTPQFIHMFEVGKWPSNHRVSAERVVQNADAMLVDAPGTVGIIESTAQASTGTYFMDLCKIAMQADRETAHEFLFVAWWEDDQYVKAIDGSLETFYASMTDYHRELWQLGATLEQINWYRHQETKPGYIVEPWRLKEEFPSTPEEAFQTGGRRVFPLPYVEAARKSCREPLAVGDLVADGEVGPDALRNIRFEKSARGRLKIWRWPGHVYPGQKHKRIVNRYCAATDIGGTTEGADYSCTGILDKAPMLLGGWPEIAAEWHGHLDHDLIAWEAARLAQWYEQALLAVEVNSLYEDNEERGEYATTVLEEILPHYSNLYMRERYNSYKEDTELVAGFHMNKSTKPMAITALKRKLREVYEHQEQGKDTILGYIERCLEAAREMDFYLLHDDGTMGSSDRSTRSARLKDDRVIVRTILAYVSDAMQPPRYAALRNVKRKPVTAASFN